MKIKFDSNFTLDFGAANQTRVYGFLYENFQNDILKNQVFYEIEVTFKDFNGNYVFEINRREVHINNKIPASKIEQIANVAGQAIFPIRIKLKRDGQIDEILNQNEIAKRWSIERKNIFEYYKGSNAETIISKIDDLFLDECRLMQSINQNWFFHLFFKPLYVSYSEKLRIKHIWKSPVFGNQFIEYGAVQTVQEKYSHDDKISINVDGISIDERTIDEIRSGYNFSKSKFSESEAACVESKFNVDYKLYTEDRSIFSVNGTFDTKIDENTNHKIQVEIYHLAESSSYRPWSDAGMKENARIFQAWQESIDDDIIDFRKPKWQVPNTPKPKIPKPPGERIELFVGVGPTVKTDSGFWHWIKSIFKKK
ncbi:hypothetical protein [Flavobacterium daemonense]|uniref:hypothetical protein n=1 Tax=Flavobacterium daemonense TaxID=1393049 RepID=UPI001186ECA4|nr:hypothetical protein [Flavobacterium daemonense]KAF2336910.1 hypothetical protein FND99_00445 [Flavobacterium daemonense]